MYIVYYIVLEVFTVTTIIHPYNFYSIPPHYIYRYGCTQLLVTSLNGPRRDVFQLRRVTSAQFALNARSHCGMKCSVT